MKLNNSIDIFCHVIDNFGDAGVVYRLAKEYQLVYPEAEIRIFTDDLAAFTAVCPAISSEVNEQQIENICYFHYKLLTEQFMNNLTIPSLIIEAFACYIPEIYLEKASVEGKLLINLDYLMAEDWVEGFHGLESPLGYQNLRKFFFMPGFTTKTGGLLPESHLDKLRSSLSVQREKLLQTFFIKYELQPAFKDSLVGTIFSYEHDFTNLLDALTKLNKPVFLFVFGKKSQKSWQYLLDKNNLSSCQNNYYNIENVFLIFSDFIPQQEYDLLINLADFNFIRGEDSWARAVRSGKPFLWHCYLEKDRYHLVKVEAFLKLYKSYFEDEWLKVYINNLFINYNERPIDSFYETSSENFTDFFQNLAIIEKNNGRFADFLRNNCNLMEKLLSFVRGLSAI